MLKKKSETSGAVFDMKNFKREWIRGVLKLE